MYQRKIAEIFTTIFTNVLQKLSKPHSADSFFLDIDKCVQSMLLSQKELI